MIEAMDGSEGLGLVSGVDKVLTELEGMGYAWTVRIRPGQVGPHPTNRDGVGVNAEDVHSLGADILGMGWSWQQVTGAVCIEESPGSTEIKDFNAKLSSGLDTLPSNELDHVRFGSLACSHTNMFLRCVAAGAVSTNVALSEAGHLSLEKIARRDPDFARAIRDGLEWKVLSSKVSTEFPDLLGLVQRARNAPNAAARAEHEVQVMLRMHGMAAAQQASSGRIDWDATRRIVAHGKPPCANYLNEISVFIAVCGGGVDGAFLRDLADFHRLGGVANHQHHHPLSAFPLSRFQRSRYSAVPRPRCPRFRYPAVPRSRFSATYVRTYVIRFSRSRCGGWF